VAEALLATQSNDYVAKLKELYCTKYIRDDSGGVYISGNHVFGNDSKRTSAISGDGALVLLDEETVP
jgi:hypothetical protein